MPVGDAIAADLPEVTSWHFVEIGGEPTELTGDLLRDDRYAIDFYPGGLVGYGGCNRFSGTFSRAGDLVTIKPSGRTQGICAQPIMVLEQRLFEILSEPVQISRPEKESLILSNSKGVVRLKQAEEAP